MTDPTSLPNFPPPADEHPLRGRVLDVLVDLGLQPNIDSDGDVAFTVNEQQLFIRCSEGEVEIMRVFGQCRRRRCVTCLMTVRTSVPFGVRAGRRIVTTGVPLAA